MTKCPNSQHGSQSGLIFNDIHFFFPHILTSDVFWSLNQQTMGDLWGFPPQLLRQPGTSWLGPSRWCGPRDLEIILEDRVMI